MRNRMRLAIVGCGDIANYVALLTKTLPSVRITACASNSREEAERFAGKHHIASAYDDYNTLLKEDDLFDAIYISTPHHLHASMIRSAIHLGFPVLCEKPITDGLLTAREIVSEVQNLRAKVGINYQYRYNPACQKLINYSHNDLGKLHYIRINIPWHREPGYFNNSTWHKKLATAGGGTLITQGSHFLDIALLAANANHVSAFGTVDRKVFNTKDIEIEDYAHGIVTLDNGAHIEITSSMVANPEQTATIEVYGENGFARFSAKKRPFFFSKGARPSQKSDPITFGIHPLARSLQGFADWVVEDKPFRTPIASALPVMTVIDAIYKSSQTRIEVKI